MSSLKRHTSPTVCLLLLGSMGMMCIGCESSIVSTKKPSDASQPIPVKGPDNPNQVSAYFGVLRGGYMGIGGESTGWMLSGGKLVRSLEVDVSRVVERANQLDGQLVTISGRVVTKAYVERGPTPILIAETINPAPASNAP